ncbi:Bug family tripartite tricarboxylate transporter substrate binding protein [Natronococcus roseus]|uniref:Bug family tripartite tricarboxylate transporter substrate binding protein n=1 Tax=Natronococcus roseus TaxID=1052014 RepID=UPI00374DC729
MGDCHTDCAVEQSGPSRRRVLSALGGTGIAATAGCLDELTEEEDWPSRQVEIIVPWAAGGGADTTSRAIADAAENETDIAWNVTNQEGGSGSIGKSVVSDSEPDGHTLGVVAPEIALFEHLDIADLGPDDITPLVQYVEMPAALIVHEDSAYDSLEEFLSHAEDNPGEIQMANSGTGSSWHLAGAGFADEADIEIEHIAYDGADSAITGVMNGEVDCTTVGATEVRSNVVDGDLMALGVMAEDVLDALPETEPMHEQGVDIEIGSWLGHFAPEGMDEQRQSEIVDTYQSALDDDAVSNYFEENHFTPVERGPDEFLEFIYDQYEYYEGLVEDLDVEM